MLCEWTLSSVSLFVFLTSIISTFVPADFQSSEHANQLPTESDDNYWKTKDLLEDLTDAVNVNLTNMEDLLRYETELTKMLHRIRNHIDIILNDTVELNLDHNRVIRDTDQMTLITNDVPSNATNVTLASLLPQNITVTTVPVIFRLFNLLASGVPAPDLYNNGTIVPGIASDNHTTIDYTPTVSTSAKVTPMADKPFVKSTNQIEGGPHAETTLSPLLEPFRNSRHSGLSDLLMNVTKCTQLTEEQLVKELKQQGTYNPDFMAWDVRGVLNFFEKATTDSYDKVKKGQDRSRIAEQNLAAIEALVKELNLKNCNLRAPDVLAKLYNFSVPRPTFDQDSDRLRTKRDDDGNHKSPYSDLDAQTKYLFDLYSNSLRDETPNQQSSSTKKDKKDSDDDIIGQVHVVPFGCRKRGTSEDGYLRLCGACQAIRRLPDNFFPPFINEVTCDEDKACLYFYDYPHGKCKQKHLNFVVLQNIGTSDCQLWRRFNLNVRVSCECFVDEMSFFAKYV